MIIASYDIELDMLWRCIVKRNRIGARDLCDDVGTVRSDWLKYFEYRPAYPLKDGCLVNDTRGGFCLCRVSRSTDRISLRLLTRKNRAKVLASCLSSCMHDVPAPDKILLLLEINPPAQDIAFL